MHHLLYELKSLTLRHKEGSYATRANRHAMLQQMGAQLLAAGYNQLHAFELKGRHVNALLRRWQTDGLSPATQKNRLSVLRWWAVQVGKPDLLKPTNAAYGIAQRQTVARTSKARVPHARVENLLPILSISRTACRHALQPVAWSIAPETLPICGQTRPCAWLSLHQASHHG